jgi:hypothetical protein
VRSTDVLINNALTNTVHYDYTAIARFSSIISTKLDFVLQLLYNYNHANQERENVAISRRLHRLLLNSLTTVQLSKRHTLKLESNIDYTTGIAMNNQITQFYLLDLSYQVKALKNERLTMGITVHDLLNSYKNYGFEYKNNAVYSYYANGIGRYFLLLLKYSF